MYFLDDFVEFFVLMREDCSLYTSLKNTHIVTHTSLHNPQKSCCLADGTAQEFNRN